MKIQRLFQLFLSKTLLIVFGLIVIFSLLYLFYYPELFSNGDESQYIHQAMAFSKGKTTLEYLDLTTWKTFNEIPSLVPPGTALLLTPFLIFGGWKALFLLPFFSHLTVTLLIILILKHEKLNPLFASAYLFYPIAVMMSRLVMSDMVNLMFVTISIYIFWTKQQHRSALLWAGIFAGLSLLIKPSNVAFFIPLFLFHIIRRRPGWIYLIFGIFIGCIPRLIVYTIIFHNPIYFFEGKPLGSGSFGLQYLFPNLIFYVLTFIVGFFGIPLTLAFYRGRFRLEIISSIIAMLLMISSYSYGPGYSAFYKSIIITNRYLLPIVPLIIIAAAGVITDKSININEQFKSYGKVMAGISLFLILIMGTATFHIHHIFLKEHAKLREAIYNKTTERSIIIHDVAVGKYLFSFWGIRHKYHWMNLKEFDILNALEHKLPVYTVFLFRSDRKWHNDCTLEFKSSLESVCKTEPLAKLEIKGEILEINRIESCIEPLPLIKNNECLRGAPLKPNLIGGIL